MECSALELCWCGEHDVLAIGCEPNEISRQRCQIGEQGAEVVHWQRFAMRGSFCLLAALSLAAGEGFALATGEERCTKRPVPATSAG